ncbi:hypothetical protein AB0G74_26985 [Streptomyces sp. NPDC020875]|uniref:hypothetical protein n=1 Tax=Streptomyces sp. NPDC020875 TaxID=3154898 RepID=UPI0033C73912
MSALPRRATRSSSLIALALLALGTAGCSANGRPGEQHSWAKAGVPAFEALYSASSVTIDMKARRDGLDVHGTLQIGRGKECRAEVTSGRGGEVRVIRTADGTAYIQVDEAQIRSGGGNRPRQRVEADVRLFAGRWLKADPSAPMTRQIVQYCDIRKLIPADHTEIEEVDLTGTVTGDGRRIRFAAKEDGVMMRVFVNRGENPTVHKIEQIGGERPMSAVFSDFGEPIQVGHPPADEVLTPDEIRTLYRDSVADLARSESG